MQRSLALTLVLTACTSTPASDDEAGTTTANESESGESSSSGDSSTSESSTSEESSETGSTSSESDVDSVGFVDGGFDAIRQEECDASFQDCAVGDKCVFVSTPEGEWSQTACRPQTGDVGAGGACMVERDGADDCDASTWCYEGTCAGFCLDLGAGPTCPRGTSCVEVGGVASACLAR